MSATAGIVASGHELTSAAGVEMLQRGGNAFDAILASLAAACVAEPLLTSLGGGGFLLAQPAGGEPVVFDFFTQTPRRKRPEAELDFRPILADFGSATQEFHIGLGAIGVPGVVAGLAHVSERLGSLGMEELVGPAVRLARDGVPVSDYQNHISHILHAILASRPGAMSLVATQDQPERIAAVGERVCHPDLADTLEALASEGAALFYQGELARQLADDCANGGGLLTAGDLANYRVVEREPVTLLSHGVQFAFNAPPSPGGTLLAAALAQLDGVDLEHEDWGSSRHALAVGEAMQQASDLRHRLFSRGTTHISVADEQGNFASLTSSNGEGCGYILPGTGIMMNNMLGEEDLNPDGFHRWPEDERLASMMCPTLATLPDGSRLALGSGGSNRIRSAVLQVLVNVFGLGLPLGEAVMAPRMHLERGHLGVEAGYPEATIAALRERWPDFRLWPEPSVFFGGVHAVEQLPGGGFRGVGDPRRGGAVAESL